MFGISSQSKQKLRSQRRSKERTTRVVLKTLLYSAHDSICPPFWILTVEWSGARSFLMTSPFSDRIVFSVHTRKQRFQKASFLNSSTLDSVLEWHCLLGPDLHRRKSQTYHWVLCRICLAQNPLLALLPHGPGCPTCP